MVLQGVLEGTPGMAEFRSEDVEAVLSHRLLCLKTSDLLCSLVEGRDDPVSIHRKDTVADALEDELVYVWKFVPVLVFGHWSLAGAPLCGHQLGLFPTAFRKTKLVVDKCRSGI